MVLLQLKYIRTLISNQAIYNLQTLILHNSIFKFIYNKNLVTCYLINIFKYSYIKLVFFTVL